MTNAILTEIDVHKLWIEFEHKFFNHADFVVVKVEISKAAEGTKVVLGHRLELHSPSD